MIDEDMVFAGVLIVLIAISAIFGLFLWTLPSPYTITVVARLENVTWEYRPRLLGPNYVVNLTFVDRNNETYNTLVDDHYEYWRSFVGKWFELTVKVHRNYKEILSIKYLGNETEVK